MTDKLRKVITDAQDILARYIVPDSGISEHECVNQLLGLLDGPQTREALSAVSASTPKEGEIEENLTEIEEAIWNATGSALLSGEKAGAADKSIIYRSLCAAGNKVAYVRELLTARSAIGPKE